MNQTHHRVRNVRAARAARALSCLALGALTLSGCSVSETPNAAGTPTSSSTPTSTTTTTSMATATSPLPATSAVPTAPGSRWTSEAQATTALADFLHAAEDATSYKMLRTDRLEFERGYFDTVTTFVVDNAAGLVHIEISFVASNEEIKQMMLEEGSDSFDDVSFDMVLDYRGDQPRLLAALPSWGGKWLDVSANDEIQSTLGPTLPTSPDGFADSALAVAALTPEYFTDSRSRLVYRVPGELAIDWMSTRMAAMLLQADVETDDLMPADAYVNAIEGGIEVVVEVADTLLSSTSVADAMQGAYARTFLQWYDLNTTEQVEVPDPSQIVTELPAG